MLGDVYNDRDGEPSVTGGSAATRPKPRRRSSLPDWADEGVLDAAFADWVPGPPSTAPAAERSMLTDLATGGESPADVQLPDLTPAPAVEPEATEAEAPTSATAPVVEPAQQQPAEPTPGRRWHREDDDILPARSRVPRTSFRLR